MQTTVKVLSLSLFFLPLSLPSHIVRVFAVRTVVIMENTNACIGSKISVYNLLYSCTNSACNFYIEELKIN